MRIIQKLIFAATGILGASFGILTTMLVNWGFNIGMSHTEAFFYGLFGGLMLGWLIAIYVSMMVMKYLRRTVATKFNGLFSIANGFLKNRRF
jgi:hypothetical protein